MNNNYNCNNYKDKSINNNDNNIITSLILKNGFYITFDFI